MEFHKESSSFRIHSEWNDLHIVNDYQTDFGEHHMEEFCIIRKDFVLKDTKFIRIFDNFEQFFCFVTQKTLI